MENQKTNKQTRSQSLPYQRTYKKKTNENIVIKNLISDNKSLKSKLNEWIVYAKSLERKTQEMTALRKQIIKENTDNLELRNEIKKLKSILDSMSKIDEDEYYNENACEV